MSDSPDIRLYQRNPDVIGTEVDGEIVLMHPVNWNYFEFNATGGTIWRLLATPSTIGMLADALAAEFEVDCDRCLTETGALLEHMVEQDLVRFAGCAA
jgi:hypothetical protein